ncbi:MAG: dihydrofolate reductase family protein [Chloroflexi bacterium]|nr:dihydrofolate reductase family protein [Chloroflexota bacterium]
MAYWSCGGRQKRSSIREARSASDISIGGAQLAGQAIAAGLVDELQLMLVPDLVGAGKRALPANAHAPLAARPP